MASGAIASDVAIASGAIALDGAMASGAMALDGAAMASAAIALDGAAIASVAIGSAEIGGQAADAMASAANTGLEAEISRDTAIAMTKVEDFIRRPFHKC
jgi:hypothetical protein